MVRILVQMHNWAIFFENEQEEAVTVNGDRYRAMLNEFLFTKIEEDRSCRLLHSQLRQQFERNYFPLLTGRIVLSNKKRNLRKYSVVFLRHFPKKKLFNEPCTTRVEILMQALTYLK